MLINTKSAIGFFMATLCGSTAYAGVISIFKTTDFTVTQALGTTVITLAQKDAEALVKDVDQGDVSAVEAAGVRIHTLSTAEDSSVHGLTEDKRPVVFVGAE